LLSNIIKRSRLLLAAIFLLVVFWGTMLVAPACGSLGYEGYTWKLTQAFAETIRDQEGQNRLYLLLGLVLILLLPGLTVFWYRYQKKLNEEVSWYTNTTIDSKTQREWMRLSFDQDLLYARHKDDKYRRAKVINMSGGGLLFATGEELQQNDELAIILVLSPGEELNLTGRVVRVTENDDSDNKHRFMIGLQFINIKKGEQDKIVRKILQEQQGTVLEERRKAKGECVLCGRPLPEGDIGVKIYCPKCSADNE